MTHPPPRVSVIIPTRDRPEYLRQAVESVVAQRRVSFEVLVVNDGKDVVPAFPDPRILILDNSCAGAIRARNLGIREARGDYIAFLDDDDWWTDDRHLELALAAHAGFTFSDGELVFMDGSPPLEFAFDATAETLSRDNTILISSICYRRDLHDRLGLFDEALPYYADWDWYLRVARSGVSFRRIAAATVAIRVHAANTSGDQLVAERRANLDLLSQKHGLGPIPLKNHLSLARESS